MNFGTNASIMPNNKIGYLDYTDLLNILPGHKKRLLDISCLSIDQILKSIDQLNSNFDTVVLANVDPWFHNDTEEQIFDHPKLSNKFVFLQTQQYDNSYLGNHKWHISFPAWYINRILPKNNQFKAKPKNLNYGFGSLNNRPALHRLLLGIELNNRNLLKNIVFTQNNSHILSGETAVEYTPGKIDPRFYQDEAWLNSQPGFQEYKKLLPILWQNQPIENRQDVYHYAETDTYCNITTEAATEHIPYNRSINLPEISEKSHKPFISGQIPVYLAAQGHNTYLKDLGYDLFDELLPANFDNYNTLSKINSIVNLIEQGKEFIEQIYFDNINRIKHNYKLISEQTTDKIILKRIQDLL